MPTPKKRHFLWEAYLALADTVPPISEAEGRQRLKETFSHLASIVDQVIETRGDMETAKALEDSVRSQAMVDRIRSQFSAMRSHGSGESGESNGSGEAGDSNGSDSNMSQRIRDFKNANRIDPKIFERG